MSSTPPKYITGGCLCGAIRYRADFPPDHDFQKMSSICMCTQCRKQSGALLLHFHVVPYASFRWVIPSSTLSHSSQPSNTNDFTEHSNTQLVAHDPFNLPNGLGDYQATPANHRYFCKVCGGLTVWFGPLTGPPFDPDTEAEIEICSGSIDEEFLVGRKDENGEVMKETGYGQWLAYPECRAIWAQNEIEGVTEMVGCKKGGGDRWKFGSDKGVRAGE